MRRAAVDPLDDEDEGFEVRHLGRAAAWASLAIVAMVGAFAAARSETGLRRINEAINQATGTTLFADARSTMPAPGSTPAVEAEARRLAQTVQTLTADRDRALARLTALERSIDQTGSLPSPSRDAPAPDALPMPGPAQSVAASVTLIPPGAGIFGPTLGGIASGPGTPTARETTPAPSPAGSAPVAAAAGSIVTQTQFGVDLGSEADIEALRSLWNTIKADYSGILEGLRPIVSARDTERRGVVALHLIVGPLDNAATAARLCAALASSGRMCRPSTFDGQRLALR